MLALLNSSRGALERHMGRGRAGNGGGGAYRERLAPEGEVLNAATSAGVGLSKCH